MSSTGPSSPVAPRPRPFLTAEWRHLLMLNFPVERPLLEPLVPAGTMLDTYKGVAYVSLVGFQFLSTKVLGLPIPGHRNFEELNLRFYVRRFAGDDWRRGVVFIRELVPRRAIAAVARTVYNEPYTSVPMEHRVTLREHSADAATVEYRWQWQNQWNHLRAAARQPFQRPAPGSLDEFITEHYWGYTRQRNGSTIEYQVEHPRWRVAPAEDVEMQFDPTPLYGSAFGPVLSQAPKSAFIADGSAVTVLRGQRLTP